MRAEDSFLSSGSALGQNPVDGGLRFVNLTNTLILTGMLFLLASSAESRAALTEADLGQAIQYHAPPGNKVEVRVGLYMLNLGGA